MPRERINVPLIRRKWEILKREAPKEVARTMLAFYKESFRVQGWRGNGFQKWKQRKKPDPGRAILIQSGALRRSIRIRKATWTQVKINSNLPYADIHNRGGLGLAFGKYPFIMPKRQFMGGITQSKQLRSKVRKTLKKQLRRVFTQ